MTPSVGTGAHSYEGGYRCRFAQVQVYTVMQVETYLSLLCTPNNNNILIPKTIYFEYSLSKRGINCVQSWLSMVLFFCAYFHGIILSFQFNVLKYEKGAGFLGSMQQKTS